MILPNKLKEGDTIAFFSPSKPITADVPKRFNKAKQFLQEKGFNLTEGSLTGKKDFYRSGSISQRVDEINSLIRNPDVKCIMSTIGGMNSNSLLPYIDYEALIRNPKIIIGYSDMTAILLGIYAKTGLTTYYGPALVASFGEFSPYQDISFEYFSDILMNLVKPPFTLKTPSFWTDEFIPWEEQDRSKNQNKNELITVNTGIAEGRLIGGNLNTIEGIWGSPYMPEIKEGDVLFIEDSLKEISTIERSFSLLKVNDVFDKISGLILGKHELFKDLGTGRKPYEVLLEVIGTPKFPILADFDCAHTHPMLTLPIGCNVKLDAANQTVTLLGKWLGDK
ncbi:MAG: LD-carboxypeptidase [Defluviitaleaceae bacterium]|nr:LD-carboxypeptidase [Defluviitaleaceae bacterium]